jgi:3-oxoacyl-(acyl-carrier-protein) synthase
MSANGTSLTREQQIQARALAEVVNEREKKLRYERDRSAAREPARIEIGPPHNIDIHTDEIGNAIAKALRDLGPIQTTHNIDFSMVAAAIKEAIESSKLTDIKVNVDVNEVGQAISKMADVMGRFEKTIADHNKLMEKLVAAISKQPEIVVNLPEQKARKKTIKRDAEGNIESVIES